MSPRANAPTLLLDAGGRAVSSIERPSAAVVVEEQGTVAMFERLARDPSVDVEKLERIIAMHERVLDRNAKAAFDAAFSQMQPEIPEIDEKGAITDRSGAVQSRYALDEDIQKALKPILQRHGFSLSFKTEWPVDGVIDIIGILAHREGHSRESRFRTAADTSGNKNDIQALGSALSYGHRYTTKDLLNITSRGQDDDGKGTSNRGVPDPPAGYDSWWLDMEALSVEGFPRLEVAWNKSSGAFKNYLSRFHRGKWEALKTKALRVKS